MTAGAEASWEGSPGDGSTSDSAALSPEALEEAALSLSSSRRAATERLQAMDEFEAAHGGEPIDQSEA